MKSKEVKCSHVIMTEMILPSHTNALDTVFGGAIMSWIDICAAICAQRHAGKVCVTASIDQLDFIAPAYKGWVVTLKSSVNLTSRTSMEIGVRVDSENPISGEISHTATAYLSFVALDSHGKPSLVPQVIMTTDKEKRRQKDAVIRREQRLNHKIQMKKAHGSSSDKKV